MMHETTGETFREDGTSTVHAELEEHYEPAEGCLLVEPYDPPIEEGAIDVPEAEKRRRALFRVIAVGKGSVIEEAVGAVVAEWHEIDRSNAQRGWVSEREYVREAAEHCRMPVPFQPGQVVLIAVSEVPLYTCWSPVGDDRERLIVPMMGVRAIVRHPEDLQGRKPTVRLHRPTEAESMAMKAGQPS